MGVKEKNPGVFFWFLIIRYLPLSDKRFLVIQLSFDISSCNKLYIVEIPAFVWPQVYI